MTRGKRSYAEHFEKFTHINEVIEKEVYPELVDLFQRDSDEFDKAIILRRELKNEKDPVQRKGIEDALQKAMKIATEIPMRIAVL